MNPPNGLQEIVALFGDIDKYIDDTGVLNPSWYRDQLAIANLPFPIPLAWKKTQLVQRITCHKLMVPIFEDVFTQIKDKGLSNLVTSFGGCFSFRQERSSNVKLSTHCWGISVDLNPDTNQQGTDGDMSPEINNIFVSVGFKWGGDWVGKRKDPMHWQMATGY